MKIQLKLVFILVFILTNTFSYAQENFKNEKLALINDIFHNITRQKIISFMEKKGFDINKIRKAEYNYSGIPIEEEARFRWYSDVEDEFEEIEILYGEKTKIVEIRYKFSGAINADFIEKELKDKKYKSKLVEFNFFGKTKSHFVWSKPRKVKYFAVHRDIGEGDMAKITCGIVD